MTCPIMDGILRGPVSCRYPALLLVHGATAMLAGMDLLPSENVKLILPTGGLSHSP